MCSRQSSTTARFSKVFKYNDALLKKEDPHIAFLADTVEPACAAFDAGRFGEMLSVIGRKAILSNIEEKRAWARDMKTLVALRGKGTIGDVVDLLKETCRLPDAVLQTENKLVNASHEEISESLTLQQIEKLRSIPYAELISLAQFINDHTPFSTKHGVKGAEFENVLVVLGRGWNQYNWNQFLEWFPDRYPTEKEGYNRNRNLFYDMFTTKEESCIARRIWLPSETKEFGAETSSYLSIVRTAHQGSSKNLKELPIALSWALKIFRAIAEG